MSVATLLLPSACTPAPSSSPVAFGELGSSSHLKFAVGMAEDPTSHSCLPGGASQGGVVASGDLGSDSHLNVAVGMADDPDPRRTNMSQLEDPQTIQRWFEVPYRKRP